MIAAAILSPCVSVLPVMLLGATSVQLADDLQPLAAELAPDRMVLVTDRAGDGTNVLGVPLGEHVDPLFDVAYGAGSAQRHRARAAVRGWEVVTVASPAFAHDVDTPADLEQLP